MSHGIRKARTRKNQSRRLHFDFLESRLCLSSYTTIDLIPLAGHDHAKAFGLNDTGLAVGTSHIVGDSTQDAAIVWSVDPAGQAEPFGLSGIDEARSVRAVEVNNQGIIVGESWIPDDTDGNRYAHAVLWTGNPGSYVPHDLDTLANLDTLEETTYENFLYSGAMSVSEPDVNGHVWVVGTSSDISVDPQVHRGVLWQVDAGGNVLSMTDLEPSSDNVAANDVRVVGNSVFVAGDFVPEESGVQACIWETASTFDPVEGKYVVTVVGRTDLPTFVGDPAPDDFRAVSAFALNNDLDVAGWGYTSDLDRDGFLYQRSTDSIVELGSLGNQGSYAWGLNDNDVVVGGYYDVKPPGSGMMGDQYAFVWENGTMYDLLEQVSDRTFWLLFSGNDVNEHGQIVGSGRVGKRNDSQVHGFLATPEDTADQQAPVANPDNYTTPPETPLNVAAPGVLENDADADGDSLTAVLDAGPTSGTLSLASDGSFTYTPDSGFIGQDSFTYVANDGTTDSNVATVKIQVTSEPAANTHVGDLDGSVVDLGRFWQADVTIAVVDQAGTPVGNATVSGTWSGDTSGSASAVTDPAGLVTVSSAKILDKKDTAIFTVDSVVHDSFDYDATANTDPDGDSDGTSIFVLQGGSATSSSLAVGDTQTIASEPSTTTSANSSSVHDPTADEPLSLEQCTAPVDEAATDELMPSTFVDEAIADLDLELLDDDLAEALALAVL
jgi:hypothetical protein